MTHRSPPARSAKPLGGVQASDLSRAMRSEIEGHVQQPRAIRPRQMIESMRVVGRDRLTARDHALYEGLVARAQEAGITAVAHTVPLADLMRYLDADIDRIKSSFERLAGTTVSYSSDSGGHEKVGWLHLLTEIHIDHWRRSPERSTVTYTLPPTVRRMLAEPASYAKVEVLAYAGFSCRYTARLYPRLALRAGYSHEVAGFDLPLSWEVDPRELAEELGHPTDPFRFSNFERDCLIPAMKDIAENVRRFTASYELKRGSGRGRPVEAIVFRFTKARSLLAESQRRDLTEEQRARITAPDHEHAADELPSDHYVAKASTMLRRDPLEISLGYRDALSLAKADPRVILSPTLNGGDLLWALTNIGADGAFEVWANSLRPGAEIPSRDRPSPAAVSAPAEKPAPVAPVSVAPVSVAPVSVAPAPAPAPVATQAPDHDARMRETAQYLIHHLDGWVGDPSRGIRSPWTDEIIRHQAAMDVSPFLFFRDRPEVAPRLASALHVIRKTSPEHRRTALRGLAQAILDMDAPALIRAAGEVIAAGVQSSPPTKTPPPVRSLNRIREVNELTAGFEDGDPLFALCDHDDRDESDFEDHDDDLSFPIHPAEAEEYLMPVDED